MIIDERFCVVDGKLLRAVAISDSNFTTQIHLLGD